MSLKNCTKVEVNIGRYSFGVGPKYNLPPFGVNVYAFAPRDYREVSANHTLYVWARGRRIIAK